MTRQVLTNLVHNAIRFDDGRGVGVRVSILSASGAAPMIRFEVSDHGPGLPAEDAKALTQPFDLTRVRYTGAGGAGLGLAICNRLVGAMGGRIGAENTGPGAVIWFELPFVADAEDDTAPDMAAESGSVQAGEGQRCLLVVRWPQDSGQVGWL